MAQHYSNPKRANDAHALPDVETFQVTMIGNTRDGLGDCPLCDDPGLTAPYKSGVSAQHADHVGWYWWTCFPGCLPDGDPNGPFATEAEALEDAREGMDGNDDDDADDECPDRESCARHSDFGGSMPHDDAIDEPEDEDYFLSDDERSIVYLGKVIAGPVSANAEPSPRDAAMRALAAYMKSEERKGGGYWPNVWAISDHGNATLISVLDCGCYFTEHDGRPELHEQAAAERMLSESMPKRKDR